MIEYRWAEGKYERFPALIAELAALNVDVIVTAGTPAALAVKRTTPSIPLVMAAVGDPIGVGLVASLARPGGNVTGLSAIAPELEGKRLELLREVVPKLSHIAVLMNPDSPVERLVVPEFQAAGAASGVEIRAVPVRTPDDFTAAFATVASSRAQALYALGNPVNFKGRHQIAEFALANRMASMFWTVSLPR